MFFVCCIYYKKSNIPVALSFLIIFSAVRGGFEPPVRLPVRQFSKLLVSATHPSFLTDSAVWLVSKRRGKDRPVFHLHKCLTSAPSLQTSADISRPSSPPKADRRAMTRAYDRVGNADRLTRRPSIRPSSEVVRVPR